MLYYSTIILHVISRYTRSRALSPALPVRFRIRQLAKIAFFFVIHMLSSAKKHDVFYFSIYCCPATLFVKAGPIEKNVNKKYYKQYLTFKKKLSLQR